MVEATTPLPILDSARIEEVFDGDANACREILQMFIADARQQAAGAQLSAGRRQFEEIATVAHTLKGAAANVGAMRLAASARALGTAARERNVDLSTQAIFDIETELRLLAEEAARSLS